MEKHVLSCWGDRPAGDVSRGDVHDLLDLVKESGPAAARNIRKHLHAMYVWAVDRELVAVNPLYRLRRDDLTPPKDVRTPLTDDQIRNLWGLDVRVGPQLRLLLLTGCRKVEVGTSHWEQYDIPNRVFTIPAERQKSGRETVIPLCQPALDILSGMPRNGAEVFGPYGYLGAGQMKPVHQSGLIMLSQHRHFPCHDFVPRFEPVEIQTGVVVSSLTLQPVHLQPTSIEKSLQLRRFDQLNRAVLQSVIA